MRRLWRKEFLDNLRPETSDPVIETSEEIDEIGFAFLVPLTAWSTVCHRREDAWIGLNSSGSCVTRMTIPIRFQAGVFIERFLENSRSEDLLRWTYRAGKYISLNIPHFLHKFFAKHVRN